MKLESFASGSVGSNRGIGGWSFKIPRGCVKKNKSTPELGLLELKINELLNKDEVVKKSGEDWILVCICIYVTKESKIMIKFENTEQGFRETK